jgi:recombinational DNA repair protein RecT
MANELQIKTQADVLALADNFIKTNNIITSKKYNVENAMVSLFTNVLSAKDKQGKSVLETCTPLSIQNAVYECITNELTPSKKQTYFIPYGNELTSQTSYFGNVKKARDVANVTIHSQVVREGDSIDVEMRANGTMLIRHKPNIKSLNKDIIMAYAVASNPTTGDVVDSDIMTIEEIKKSWAKSRSGGAVSKEFPHEMARRTVTNRLAKHFINTSDDSNKIIITNPDGTQIQLNEYDDLINTDYTINTDEQESFENEPFNPETNDYVVTAENLSLGNLSPIDSADIPEGAFEIPYAEYKNNKEKYLMVKDSYNSSKKTCMVQILEQ